MDEGGSYIRLGGGSIADSPYTCQVKSTFNENEALLPKAPVPLRPTNHREELMITLYNYSAEL